MANCISFTVRTLIVPAVLLLFVAICSAGFLDCDVSRCCLGAADDGDIDVALATVAVGVVVEAVVTVIGDDDGEDDGTGELGAADSAAAIPASRRLRINPTCSITKCRAFSTSSKDVY